MVNAVLALANSIWFVNNGQEDKILNRNWLNDNIASIYGLQLNTLNDDFYQKLLQLRKVTIDILESRNLEPYTSQLNHYMSMAPTYHQIMMENKVLVMEERSNASMEFQLLSQLSNAIISLFSMDRITDIKHCANDECQFFFLDNSKNKSKKYCSSKCNNLMKVRRFRSKDHS